MNGFRKTFAGLVLLPALAFAGDLASAQSTATPPGSLSHGDTDLRMLLREMGARLHKHFVTDPKVRQTLDLGGLEPKDLTYPELLSILQVNGWVVVADDGLLQVIPNVDVRESALPLVSPENIKRWMTNGSLV